MKFNLFAPDGIKKFIAVLKHDLFDQFFKSIIAVCFYPAEYYTKKFRQLTGFEYKFSHHTKAATATTLQCPEQIGMFTCVDNLNRSIGQYDLCFQKCCCSKAIIFGKAAEASTLDQTAHSNCHTSATLNISSIFCCHFVIG